MQDDKVSIKFGSATVLITALLCILKVTGYLSISWLWCFCLLWLPFALVLGVIGLILVCAIIYAIVILVTELTTR